MTPQYALSQEWTTLQTHHEQYETGGLIIKLASVALTVAGFALHLNLKLMLALVALLWLQEGIYRTFQSRLGQRILRVEQLIKRGAHESDSMAPAQTTPMQLIVPPEGTRSKTRYWKTGFYYIAAGAQVPIIMAYMDYGKKITGLGPVFLPTGDLDADMASIKAFYAPIKGKNTDQFHAG